MANIERNFDIVGGINDSQQARVKKAIEDLDGVNHVKLTSGGEKVTVGYTPEMTNVQIIKEAIESQGLDVSDMGDD